MILKTPTKDEAASLIENDSFFRGCEIVDGALPPDFILKEASKEDSSNWVMPRLLIIEKKVVGSGGFKSEPEDNSIEIGYSVAPAYRNKGYASLAVKHLIEEASAHEGIKEIIAESTISNIASQKVLLKNDFEVYGEGFDDDEKTLKMKRNISSNKALERNSETLRASESLS